LIYFYSYIFRIKFIWCVNHKIEAKRFKYILKSFFLSFALNPMNYLESQATSPMTTATIMMRRRIRSIFFRLALFLYCSACLNWSAPSRILKNRGFNRADNYKKNPVNAHLILAVSTFCSMESTNAPWS
jgi:hypothetical protein